MNQGMWRNPTMRANAEQLTARGIALVYPATEGVQTCGDVGFGRMLEVDELLQNWRRA